MKVKTISVIYERKLNLGDYNSATIGATLWADLEDGEDESDAISALQITARVHVRNEVLRLMKKPVTAPEPEPVLEPVS